MPDADIDSLVAGLRSARLTAEHSKNVQDDLFDRHATLIDAYRELSKSQQRADEASNSSTESPIIVLLIDANTCHFHDDLLRRRQRGGRDAAELLYQQALSVARKRKVPTSTCQVKIKCYGDLAALSKEGFRKGVAGAEGRCLAPFFFGFSSAFTGCEFIDVGEDIYERIAGRSSPFDIC